jgi:hypothetical protein
MLRFHGKALKAVMTEAISHNKPVLLVNRSRDYGGVYLTVQSEAQAREDAGPLVRGCHTACADWCRPDLSPGHLTLSRLLAGANDYVLPLPLTEGGMWDIIAKHHQLTLTLSGETVDVFSAEREYLSVSDYRDVTDRLHMTVIAHFGVCTTRNELYYWRQTALRLLRSIRPLACRRASESDHYRFLMAAHNLECRTECVSPDGALRLLSA